MKDCKRRFASSDRFLQTPLSVAAGESAASLRKLLDKANKQLSKLGNVNKKALDQYQQFTEQREELEKRRTEINKAYDSITQLIDHLDHKKDEAIERTFKQVSMNFKDVFHRLVPGGRGELVMQRKRAAPRDADEDEDAPLRRRGDLHSATSTACENQGEFRTRRDDANETTLRWSENRCRGRAHLCDSKV